MADTSDWIEWAGLSSVPPVRPLTMVEVQYAADPDPDKGVRIEWPMPASAFQWMHDGEDDDIIAYRVVRQ